MDNLLFTLTALLLVLLNGFFVAAEFALVKLRITQAEALAEDHGLPGRVLKTVRTHLETYLSACQLGITLASLALGWIGEPAFAELIKPVLVGLGIASPKLIHDIAFAFAFGAISFLHIVLGELAPKSMAIRRPESLSLWTALPLYLFYWLMFPFIWVLNVSANATLRIIGVPAGDGTEDAHSLDEIKKVLVASHRHGELNQHEAEALSRALDLPELEVGDFMRPARDLLMLDVDEPIETLLATIDDARYSRYPVYAGERQNVLGIVHVKDLFSMLRQHKPIDLRTLLRPVIRIHRDRPGTELFEQLKLGATRFALIEDDAGTLVGFATLMHVLETLHGQMQDEFPHRKDEWLEVADGVYEGSGSMPIYSLERMLDILIEADQVDSVGGMVIAKLGQIPVKGDHADFDDFSIQILEMEQARVLKVRVTAHPRARNSH